MVNQVIKDTFTNVYRDDYRDSDNYYKILYNNGRSLQQRELNQMQTIINEDIRAISSYTFVPGAAVTGAAPSLETQVPYIKLNTSETLYQLPDTPTSLENLVFEEDVSGVRLQISKVIPAADGDPDTIFVTYVDDNNESRDVYTPVTPGRILSQVGGSEKLKVQTTNTSSNPATGFGSLYTVQSGRIYVDGHYVYTPIQKLVLSKYSREPSEIVGFLVSESIITVSDDENLYDNSGPNLNISAPGADRYRIRLTLTTRDQVDSDQYFIKLAEIENGIITYELNNQNGFGSELNKIKDVIATNLFKTNGSFVIRPAVIDFEFNPDDNDTFYFKMDPIQAFVEGYYFETGEKRITQDKPRETGTLADQQTVANYGNWVIASSITGLLDFNTFEEVNLQNTTGYGSGGNTIGTAKVRAIQKFGTEYKIYLFEVQMTAGNKFTAIRSIGTSTSVYADIKLDNGVAKLYQQIENSILFPLTRSRPESISDISLTVQYTIEESTGASDTSITIYPESGYVFDDPSSWIIVRTDTGAVLTPSITNNSSSATISGLPNSTTFRIAALQQTTGGSGAFRSKTLTTNTMSGESLDSDGQLLLDHPDVYELVSVTDDASSEDITSDFVLDNGQRDNFYDVGKITINPTAIQPSGTITVEYRYFAHGATGNFFCKNSYDGQIDYEDIPSYKKSNGDIIALRDYLDFRPSRTPGSTDFGERFRLPIRGDNVTYDASFYLPQRGVIHLTKTGASNEPATVGIRLGQASFNPEYPVMSKESIILARVDFNPYMVNEEDVTITYQQNKRYTMKDIGRLDQKIEDLREFTARSLKEFEATKYVAYDSDGFQRIQAGIVVDEFADHNRSDIYEDPNNNIRNIEYKASLDLTIGEARPRVNQENIELVFDSADPNTSGVRLVGDTITFDYTNVLWKEQASVSRAIPVAPQANTKFIGDISLSPSSDNWVDTQRIPKKVIKGQTKISVEVDDTVNWHDVGWNGLTEQELQKYVEGDRVLESETSLGTSVDDGGDFDQFRERYRTTSTYLKEVETVKVSMGDRIIQKTNIPYMRSRFISFRATGLRPNTRHFFYFDKRDVNSFIYSVTGDSEFERISSLASDSPLLEAASELYTNATEFPAVGAISGPTAEHYTDANGAISGYFFLPNTDSINFTSGEKLFMIIDVNDNFDENFTSKVTTTYTASGVLEKIQEEETETRQYRLETFSTVSTRRISSYTWNSSYGTDDDRFWSCFVKGTMVTMANGLRKKIEDVEIGDLLKGKTCTNKVMAFDHPPLNGRPLVSINGGKPFMTTEHPLYTREGWKSYNEELTKQVKPWIADEMVGNLQPGDEVLTSNGTWFKIESLELHKDQPEQTVYNFFLDGDNTYFADGLLAHNRDGNRA